MDNARVTIYNFIRDDIGMNIPNLHHVLCQQHTWLTWNKRAQSLETVRTNFYQIQNNQHDPSTHDGSQSKHEGTVWGEMADTHSKFHDYKHNTGAAAEEFDADTLTAVYEEIASPTPSTSTTRSSSPLTPLSPRTRSLTLTPLSPRTGSLPPSPPSPPGARSSTLSPPPPPSRSLQ